MALRNSADFDNLCSEADGEINKNFSYYLGAGFVINYLSAIRRLLGNWSLKDAVASCFAWEKIEDIGKGL